MLAARLPADAAGHGKKNLFERGFARMQAGYERGVDLCLRWPFAVLLVFFASVALTAWMFVVIPKGFFPPRISASSRSPRRPARTSRSTR